MTGLLFGIVPALQLSTPDLTHALKEGARGSVGAGRQRLRSALVVAEVALAVVLLVGAALFIGSFVTLMRIDPGFDPENVLTVRCRRGSSRASRPPDQCRVRTRDIVDRISAGAGRRARVGHLRRHAARRQHELDHARRFPEAKAARTASGISIRRVTPDYHQALRIPLKRGRLFDADRSRQARRT